MKISGVVVDASALVLPVVGGAQAVQLDWVPALIQRLSQLVLRVPQEGNILVIGEAALAIPVAYGRTDRAVERVTVNVVALEEYLGGGFAGIYGALGVPVPKTLDSAAYDTQQESLGHAVVRYLLSRAAQGSPGPTSLALDGVNVDVVQIAGALTVTEHADLECRAAAADLTIVASHAVSGQVPAGMGAVRAEVQDEIARVIGRLDLT